MMPAPDRKRIPPKACNSMEPCQPLSPKPAPLQVSAAQIFYRVRIRVEQLKTRDMLLDLRRLLKKANNNRPAVAGVGASHPGQSLSPIAPKMPVNYSSLSLGHLLLESLGWCQSARYSLLYDGTSSLECTQARPRQWQNHVLLHQAVHIFTAIAR